MTATAEGIRIEEAGLAERIRNLATMHGTHPLCIGISGTEHSIAAGLAKLDRLSSVNLPLTNPCAEILLGPLPGLEDSKDLDPGSGGVSNE